MSNCNNLLKPLFEEFTENAIRKDKADYGTPEWEECEQKSKRLYEEISNVFFRYYPEYKRGKKHQKSRNLKEDGNK